jgi:hypothetical protein
MEEAGSCAKFLQRARSYIYQIFGAGKILKLEEFKIK